jgi:S-DNA-T family DNA segregation ATPase FtsK/SpoIIIE
VSEKEVKNLIEFLKQVGPPVYHQELLELGEELDLEGTDKDKLFEEAVKIVLTTQRGSVSLLQRKLNIGYCRAARLIDIMAKMGIVGEYKGSSARDVLISLEQWLAKKKKDGS